MTIKMLPILGRRLTELRALDATADNWAAITSWHAQTRPLVATDFHSHLDQFDRHVNVKWPSPPIVFLAGGRDSRRPTDDAQIARKNDALVHDAKAKLLALLEGIMEIEDAKNASPPDGAARADNAPTSSPPTPNVFVVHGHDEEMKQHVARTLSQLGLAPIILHEQPSGGKTVIEKFEANADVGFAVVLLSPDDKAFPAAGKPKDARPRARQNVILELGYFVGRLGRNRVFTLKRNDLEIPSDFSGVVYTAFDAAGHWRFALVKEMRAAGYTLDANSLL